MGLGCDWPCFNASSISISLCIRAVVQVPDFIDSLLSLLSCLASCLFPPSTSESGAQRGSRRDSIANLHVAEATG